MNTAVAAYLVAAALRIRFHLSNEEAVKQAADLWNMLQQRF